MHQRRMGRKISKFAAGAGANAVRDGATPDFVTDFRCRGGVRLRRGRQSLDGPVRKAVRF